MATKKNTRLYADLDLDFEAHPLNGDVAMKYNEEAVKRSIRNLIMYNKFEKPFNPGFGSSVREMLFENIKTSTAIGIETRITKMIKAHEKRCRLKKVKAIPDISNSQYEVVITFSVLNVMNPITTTVYLQRVR